MSLAEFLEQPVPVPNEVDSLVFRGHLRGKLSIKLVFHRKLRGTVNTVCTMCSMDRYKVNKFILGFLGQLGSKKKYKCS